jgi:hypothetical protein
MSTTRKSSGDHKIGKGKPPKHRQWKPGQSGNPKGRPKVAKPGPTDVAAILDEPLRVKKAGAIERMSAFEVGVRRLVKRALNNNDLKAILEFVALCEGHGLIAPPQPLEQSGGVLVVPWDWDEWQRMWDEFWPAVIARQRSGLPDEHGVGPTQEEH